jgi:hypothetical protein
MLNLVEQQKSRIHINLVQLFPALTLKYRSEDLVACLKRPSF